MFFGEFEYKLDEKGRVPIPPRFRNALREGVVLSAGLEKCINIYPLSEWKNMAASLAGGIASPAKMRRLSRATFATAFKLDVDKQGRVILPVPLRQYALIEGDVVVAGVNNYLELWDKELWGAEKSVSQEQAGQIIESIERHRGG